MEDDGKDDGRYVIMRQLWWLGGGNSNIFYFHPEKLGKWSILTSAYFSDGLGNNHQLE